MNVHQPFTKDKEHDGMHPIVISMVVNSSIQRFLPLNWVLVIVGLTTSIPQVTPYVE